MQIILVITAPINETDISSVEQDIMFFAVINISRQIPYPPNFSKIAAKIILPAMGASTCAFGNHRCIVNIGNFTRNPIIIKGVIIGGKFS